MEKKTAPKNIDIWLVFVIVLMVLSLAGGLFLTRKSIMAQIEQVNIRQGSQISSLQSEIFELRKQIQHVSLQIKKCTPSPSAE